jgi:hypothetical protein
MVDVPSCNLSETIHNKWQQQSGNHGDNLFAATYDDKIRAFMQMTNYRTYTKGNLLKIGLSRQELKIRVARRSGDPKKIVDTFSQLPNMEGVTARILHLKGKETFGSTKQKLDLPPSDDGDSHRLKFSQPRVQTKSRNGPYRVCKGIIYNSKPRIIASCHNGTRLRLTIVHCSNFTQIQL